MYWERSIAPPIGAQQFVREVADQSFRRVWRRGKFLVMELNTRGYLLAHLRMTGQLCIEPAATPCSSHVRVRFHLDGEQDLRFSDMRKFGRLYLVDDPAARGWSRWGRSRYPTNSLLSDSPRC